MSKTVYLDTNVFDHIQKRLGVTEEDYQALKEAVNEARSKANAIAEALNVRLLGVLQVNEGGISIRPVVVSEARLMSASATATPVSPGHVTVNGSVSIRYRIGP